MLHSKYQGSKLCDFRQEFSLKIHSWNLVMQQTGTILTNYQRGPYIRIIPAQFGQNPASRLRGDVLWSKCWWWVMYDWWCMPEIIIPMLFKKSDGDIAIAYVCPSRYLLLKPLDVIQPNLVCVLLTCMGCARHIFWGPAPWGPGEGPKGQILFNII